MIWFWRLELQGGLQSLNYGVIVQQLSEAKALQLVMISLTGKHWLTVADVIS